MLRGCGSLLAVAALLAAGPAPAHAHHEAHCREYAESIWRMDYEMRATRRKGDMQSIISAQNDAVVWPVTLLQEMVDADHTATSQADVDRVWQSMDAMETAKAAVFDAMGAGELLDRHALLQFGDAQDCAFTKPPTASPSWALRPVKPDGTNARQGLSMRRITRLMSSTNTEMSLR